MWPAHVVLCHDVIMSEGDQDDTDWFNVAQAAVDALKGDPTFLERTCNCPGKLLEDKPPGNKKRPGGKRKHEQPDKEAMAVDQLL